MIQPGMMMGQMTLPPSQTWSSGSGGPPPPSMSRSSEHDDRDERDYERERSRKRRESMNWRERADEDNRSWRERADEDNKRSRDRSRDRSPGRYRERSPGDEDWRHATPNNTVMIRGLPQNITEQHVQDNITSHSLAARDIRLIREKKTQVLCPRLLTRHRATNCRATFSFHKVQGTRPGKTVKCNLSKSKSPPGDDGENAVESQVEVDRPQEWVARKFEFDQIFCHRSIHTFPDINSATIVG